MMWSFAKQSDLPEADSAVLMRMSAIARLSPLERAVLRDVAAHARSFPAQTELCIEGRVQPPQVLLAGWACYQRLLGDGRRQIIGFLLPGDIIGSVTRSNMLASQTAAALTPVTVADARLLLPAADGAASAMPGLSQAIQHIAYMEDVRMRDHVVRLGRQTAYERVVHLMLEFRSRLAVVGQVVDDGFAVPVTQEVLADALGLSVVHINRTLQQIRRDRLFELRGGQLKLRQIELMQAMVDWAQPSG